MCLKVFDLIYTTAPFLRSNQKMSRTLSENDFDIWIVFYQNNGKATWKHIF